MTPFLDAAALGLPGRLGATDLRMERPALVCLVGPNGSGKTSLLHALARIGGPAGAVRIEGQDPERLGPNARKRLLAYLGAGRELPWPLAARDAIALGLPAGTAPDPVIETLATGELADRRIDRLSTGERSRILLARAIAPAPRLLLLDEPAANLDPAWQLRLMALLRRLVAERSIGTIAALHDLDLAARFADRLVLMEGGRIAADGTPAELLDGPHLRAVFGIRRGTKGWELA
ncbi:MAG: iron complex transport system ATP-binding protein [Solirubrobacteraceae bacterium]|jgi:iron complex transport system ATP-binding protein|nr:iron complex transport system ATP-binding protein [Solirubrobacteraceae bacterium]